MQRRLQRALIPSTLLALDLTTVAWGTGLGGAGDDPAALEAAAFVEADANGDGKLTPDEFANFEAIMRQKVAGLRFSGLDANGDGVLTLEELSAARPGGRTGFLPPPPPF